MESKMLDEIKSETKPEAAVADLDILDKQLRAFQARLQTQTVVPSLNQSRNHDVSQNADEEQVVNFGWEELEDGFILPFVKRKSENYVANHIVAELVYKKIQKEFSNEMLFCMALIMERMTQKEADTFNEININHCDRSIVGNYSFKANEFMIKLEYVKQLVDFYTACHNLILLKIKENNLFGFIKIAGESQVPFIYNDSKKLVPLFYFEGQSEYLDTRSTNLTDPFKLGYLKFCCKIQKLKKEIYEQNPLKVVNFEDVKKLFPEGTTFHLTIPEKVNQDLLAPEIRIALLHGMEAGIPVLQYHHTSISTVHSNPLGGEINNNIPDTSSSAKETNNNNSDDAVSKNPIFENLLVESNNQNQNPREENDVEPEVHKTLETELMKYKEHMRLNRIEAKRAQKRPAQSVKVIETKRSKIDAVQPAFQSNTMPKEDNLKNSSFKPVQVSLHQSREVQQTYPIKNPQETAFGHLLKPKELSRISQECAITPVHRKETNGQQSNSERVSELAMFTSVAAPFNRNPRANQDISTVGKPNQNNSDRISELATVTPVVASSSSSTFKKIKEDVGAIRESSKQNCQITNVPYQSPRGASSPGILQATQVMNEAAQRVQGYSQGTIMHVPKIINTSTQQTACTSRISPTVINQIHHVGQQFSINARNISNVNTQQQNCISHEVPNKPNNSGPHYPHPTAQATSSHLRYYPPVLNNTAMQYQDGRSNQHNVGSQMQENPQNHWHRLQQQWFLEQQMQRRSFVPRPTQQVVQQTSFLHHQQQQMHQPSSFLRSQQLEIQQTTGFSNPQVINNPNQNFQNLPVTTSNSHQAYSGPYFQQYGNTTAPVVQNVNISYGESIVSRNTVQNYLPGSTISAITTSNVNSFHSQDINNNARNPHTDWKTTVIEHPPYIAPNPEFYEIKSWPINGKLLLGISKVPVSQTFLVNLSDFVEKVLGLNPFVNQTNLPSRFNTLYRLNQIQKIQWDRVSSVKQLQFVGPFKDLFVDYNEILA